MFQASLRKSSAAKRFSASSLPRLVCYPRHGPSLATWRQLSSSSRLLSDSADRRASRTYSIDLSTRVNYSFTSLNNGLLLPGRLSQGIVSHQRRHMSSDDKKQKPPVTTSAPVDAEETGRLGGIVPALRQRVTEFNTGDLVSVYGIVLLIVAIVFAPFIAKYVQYMHIYHV
jgi:hypothetical protein